MGDERTLQARLFGSAAAAYERGRPPYPASAIDWLLPSGARQVLDLGAGTGKLTRELCERGLEVIAVDPSSGMRAELVRALPAIDVREGTAEEIPLAGASVDAVLMAQAWHWVNPDRALPEVARVLKPEGRLGLLWNIRQAEEGWIREFEQILPPAAVHSMAPPMWTGACSARRKSRSSVGITTSGRSS